MKFQLNNILNKIFSKDLKEKLKILKYKITYKQKLS